MKEEVWWSDFKRFVDAVLEAERAKDMRINFSGPLPSVKEVVKGHAFVEVTFFVGKCGGRAK